MKSPALWIVLLAVLAGVVYWGIRRRGHADQPELFDAPNGFPGFKEAYRDPVGTMERLAEAHNQIDELSSAAAEWPDAQIAEKLREFVFAKKAAHMLWAESAVLKSLGDRLHRPVENLLTDASVRDPLQTPARTDDKHDLPFGRACSLLEDDPPPQIVGALGPFIGAESHYVRNHAALMLGAVGSEAALPGLRRALTDPDEYVRSYAIIGLGRALQANRLSPSVRSELFAPLFQCVVDDVNGSEAAGLMLQLDEQRAAPMLICDRFFAADVPQRFQVLKAFAGRKVEVPRSRLLEVIAETGQVDLTEPKKYIIARTLGLALELLGRHQHPGDDDLLESYASHSDENVAEGTVQGLLVWHGLEDFESRIGKIEQERGVEALTKPQRCYTPVMWLDGEVRNGGFSQYFFNSSGDGWRDALAGLDLMGLTEQAALLRAAVAKFGSQPPSTDRDERMLQLSAIEDGDDSPFDDLETRYYELTPPVRVAALRYVVRHREAFQ